MHYKWVVLNTVRGACQEVPSYQLERAPVIILAFLQGLLPKTYWWAISNKSWEWLTSMYISSIPKRSIFLDLDDLLFSMPGFAQV